MARSKDLSCPELYSLFSVSLLSIVLSTIASSNRETKYLVDGVMHWNQYQIPEGFCYFVETARNLNKCL
jgi:hypothetical protein